MNQHQSDMRRNAAIGLIAPYGARRQRGFTLVELVMVIALAGIVAVMISTVLARPLEGFVAQSRRAELVDLAASALNRMARDIRLAVPNSLRLSSDERTLETLNIQSAGRYRPNRVGGEGLRFTSDAAGTCNSSTLDGGCDSFQALNAALDVAEARWLVVYNVGAVSGGGPLAGSNVWNPANPGVIFPTTVGSAVTPGFSELASGVADETQVQLSGLPAGGFRFAYASPQRRFYLADQVIGYRCDLPNARLLRYTSDALSLAASNTAPSGAQVMANQVSACAFTYQPGSTQRAGLVTLSLSLSLNGETVSLLQQVHVDNAP